MSNADETITDIGHKGFQQVQDDFSVAYRDLWDDVKPDNININAVNEGTESSLEALRLLPKHAQARARKDVIHLATEIKKFADSGDTLYLDQLDDFLRKKMNAGDDQFVKDFYSDMRGNFRNAMPDDIPDLLNQIDSVYRDFKTVEHGAGYLKPQEMKAVFTPRQIESAVKAKNSASATTKGEAGPVQDLAGKATDTVAQVLPDRSEISSAADLGRWGTLLGLVTAPAAVATLPFSKVAINETMRKMMTGLPLSKAEQRVAAALRQAGVTGIKESGMQREPIAPPMLEGENYYP